MRTNKTILYSLENGETLNQKEILEQGYDLNATIEEGNYGFYLEKY